MATNGDESFFARYIEKAPTPIEPAPLPTPPEVRRLLYWLQNTWKRPVICARDIQRFGPSPVRDRESALNAAETLTKRGWLLPLKTHRYDRKRWQVTVGPA
jgi:hypothetical protein